MGTIVKTKKSVIVVSGPPGSGSTSVAKELAKRLHLRLMVLGKLHKGLVKEKRESIAALQSWSTKKGISKKTHVDRDRMQVREAKKGNVVICGKLSVHFLKDLSEYKIWLDVPLEERARRSAKRDRITVKDAMKQIRKRQNIERKEWKRIYGFDYFYQKRIADFVIGSSGMTLEKTVRSITDFIKSRR